MPSVSAVVLTRDSERTIEQCIRALLPAVDYVTVVDTGSTDNTVQIAKECGARVYHFEWRDDFAAARNFGDSLATTDWIIHVDSDEILRSEDTNKIRKLCSQYRKTNGPIVVTIQQINVKPDTTSVEHAIRMYKRGTVIWKGMIHEQLDGKREMISGIIHSDIGVIHDGYNPEIVDVQSKILTRNIPLLKKGVELDPNNANYHFFLGREYKIVGEYQAAIPHLKLSIELMEQQGYKMQLENARKLLIQCLETVNTPLESM